MTLFELYWLDLVAFLWFLTCWIGYTLYADSSAAGRSQSLMANVDAERRAWMTRMLERENRIPDVALIGNLMRSVSFFASTTIFIVGGLLAVLGASEEAIALLTEIPFVAKVPRLMWEMKLLLLVLMFVYSFFKFTWSLRQFNYCSVMLGGAPLHTESREVGLPYAERIARLNGLAANSFNRGLRAYYFGLAALCWFIHPALFILVAGWVVAVLYRREFHSKTLKTIASG